MVEPDRVNRGHSDRSHDRVFVLERLDTVFELEVAIDQVLAALVIHLALRREHQRTLGTIDQLHPQPHLELVDGLARRRLRDPVFRGPPRKTRPPHDVTENLQRLELHTFLAYRHFLDNALELYRNP